MKELLFDWFLIKQMRDMIVNYKTNRFTVPMGFNKAVIGNLQGMNPVSSTYISMVRRGQRTNDRILKAIIETDHNWEQIKYERLKKML